MAEVEEKCEINGEKDGDIIEEVGETQTQKKKKKKKKKKKTGRTDSLIHAHNKLPKCLISFFIIIMQHVNR